MSQSKNNQQTPPLIGILVAFLKEIKEEDDPQRAQRVLQEAENDLKNIDQKEDDDDEKKQDMVVIEENSIIEQDVRQPDVEIDEGDKPKPSENQEQIVIDKADDGTKQGQKVEENPKNLEKDAKSDKPDENLKGLEKGVDNQESQGNAPHPQDEKVSSDPNTSQKDGEVKSVKEEKQQEPKEDPKKEEEQGVGEEQRIQSIPSNNEVNDNKEAKEDLQKRHMTPTSIADLEQIKLEPIDKETASDVIKNPSLLLKNNYTSCKPQKPNFKFIPLAQTNTKSLTTTNRKETELSEIVEPTPRIVEKDYAATSERKKQDFLIKSVDRASLARSSSSVRDSRYQKASIFSTKSINGYGTKYFPKFAYPGESFEFLRRTYGFKKPLDNYRPKLFKGTGKEILTNYNWVGSSSCSSKRLRSITRGNASKASKSSKLSKVALPSVKMNKKKHVRRKGGSLAPFKTMKNPFHLSISAHLKTKKRIPDEARGTHYRRKFKI